VQSSMGTGNCKGLVTVREVEGFYFIFLPSPLHAHHEQQHAADRQQASNVIDLRKHLFAGKTLAVDTRRRVVENSCDH
jgi:hypothetical protein